MDYMGDAKKLEDLTNEEIMQLTREDCRRYLKEKGMRRPSWNKAQALQQVLSLKSLCDGDKVAAGKRTASPSPFNASTAAKKQATMNTNEGASQLTMFYAGNVSVFEDVSADKAYAIMLLAGNANSFGKLLFSTPLELLELPQARKASLQRFLQKRRERLAISNEVLKSPPSENS